MYIGVAAILVKLSKKKKKDGDISIVTSMLSMMYEDVKTPYKESIKYRVRNSSKC